MKFRCEFKVETFAYCHLDGTLLSYFSASLCIKSIKHHAPSDPLARTLSISKRNLISLGEHFFSSVAPSVWISLSASLRNLTTLSEFKTQLKTFLYRQAFQQIRVDWGFFLLVFFFFSFVFVCLYIYIHTYTYIYICVCVCVCVLVSVNGEC